MRLLRTIFIHHRRRHHLLNPKSVFSSLVSNSSAKIAQDDGESLHFNTSNQPTTSWSMYANVVAKQRINDNSDEEIEEEKPIESENGNMLNLKNRTIIRTTKRSSGKVKTQWVCCNCGFTAGQWWGTCPSCSNVGTMKEFHEAKLNDTVDNSKLRNGLSVSEDSMGTWLPQRGGQLKPVNLSEVYRGFNLKGWRFPL